MNNNLIIAAAGSGKTTYLVNNSLDIPKSERVLITTYTENNEAEIRKKIVEKAGCIPSNITVQTWFSLLLQHGIRPFQGSMNDSLWKMDIKGMKLVNEPSGLKYTGRHGPVYWGESDFLKHYFTKENKIYSDKISKFVVTCDKKTGGAVVSRLSKIYSNIFIDEIQDLAGYDLDFIKLLFKSSSNILLVGDPRQVTYLTHHSRKYDRYSNGNIKKFVENELGKRIKCSVDEITLNDSHRNNQSICNFSSKLYPEFPTPNPCTCQSCRENPPEHEGIYLVNKADVENYLEKYNPVQLRWDIRTKVNENYNVMNFGASKGLTFDRVLIYPNEKMKKWIKNNSYDLKNETRAKFYVAITRARYSVGIVMDHGMEEYDGIEKYSPENNV